jgi:hypothetical protein
MKTTVYKSSPSLVFRNFIRILIIPILLFAALSVASDAQNIMTVLCSMLVFATVLATYFAFYRNNIIIEVTANAVKFSRHGTEYLNFERETHEFTSNIITQSYTLIKTGTSRYLRVISKNGSKYKDYKCYNFDKKIFEEFIALVSANSFEQQVKTEYHGEPLIFAINKNFMLEKCRKDKFINFGVISVALLCLVAIKLVPNINLSPKTFVFIALFSILASVFSILRIVQFSKVKKQTPEKITICKDKLTVNSEDFYFSYLTQIKMTPPSYQRNIQEALPWQKLFRTMTITERNISRKYIIDLMPEKIDKPQSAFLEYSILFNELRKLFVSGENKFIAELE